MNKNIIKEEWWLIIDAWDKQKNKIEKVNIRSYDGKEIKKTYKRLQAAKRSEINSIFREETGLGSHLEVDMIIGLFRDSWERIDM